MIVIKLIALGIVLFILNMVMAGAMGIEIDFDYFLPSTLYDNTKMNMFGCIICSILLFIINYDYCIVYCICKFTRWIFTVGRKEETNDNRTN